jgi:hypothetical protein
MMDRGTHGRRDRLIKERRHDVYQARMKWPEPTVCPSCRAVLSGGRWTWNEPPEDANAAVCPACRRAAEKLPAGVVEIRGEFFVQHRDEILNLVHNVEQQEKAQHPLERIMAIRNGGGAARIETTGVHIARGIGEALARAYKGKLSLRYPDEDSTIQVSWER